MKCAECVGLGLNPALGRLGLEACPKLDASLGCINKLQANLGLQCKTGPAVAPL